MCQELAELGMEMARAAARKAMRDWAAEEAAAAADPVPATADADAASPAAKTPDPGLLFARLSGAVRQAIALEARIAAGPAPAALRSAKYPPPDPRRATLRQVLTDITAPLPDRDRIRRETLDHLEDELAADPEGEVAIGDMFKSICEDLGVPINWNKIHDRTLAALYPKPAAQGHGADPPE